MAVRKPWGDMPAWLQRLVTEKTLESGRAIPWKCRCGAWCLGGYSEGWRRDPRFLGTFKLVDPYALGPDEEAAAIALGRERYELAGFPKPRLRRRYQRWQNPDLAAVVVVEHDCTRPPLSDIPLPKKESGDYCCTTGCGGGCEPPF